MPAMRLSLVPMLALGVSAGLAGCSPEPVDSTAGVVYCSSPLVEQDVEHVEYRQDGEVIASTELEPGRTYRAQVPANALTEIYVDGRLVGSSGDDDLGGEVTGGYVALLGEGCPEYVEP